MGPLFVKHNRSDYKDALYAEADGLRWLEQGLQGTCLSVPEVFAVSTEKLEMAWIQSGSWTDPCWQKLAEGLAFLHGKTQTQFGFLTNNYIGLNPQQNTLSDNWGEFFVKYRLEFQLEMVRNESVRDQFRDTLEMKGPLLIDFLDTHCPHASLVHGDLWNGNVLCDLEGHVWLIDPAVYFGDREVDIAMSEMFGGFAPAFYQSYRQLLPLSSVYETKKNFYNLYHYLNHYNLFGQSYLPACTRAFDLMARL